MGCGSRSTDPLGRGVRVGSGCGLKASAAPLRASTEGKKGPGLNGTEISPTDYLDPGACFQGVGLRSVRDGVDQPGVGDAKLCVDRHLDLAVLALGRGRTNLTYPIQNHQRPVMRLRQLKFQTPPRDGHFAPSRLLIPLPIRVANL